MGDYVFGNYLGGATAQAVSSPSMESYSTASGGVEGLVTGKVYPIGLIDVDDRCLRFIGKPHSYVCLKEGCDKHQANQALITNKASRHRQSDTHITTMTFH